MSDEEAIVVKDSNGNILQDGDSVHVIKDLPMKGASITVKRGDVIKNIRLIEDDEEHVLARIGKTTFYLKTEFVKKKA